MGKIETNSLESWKEFLYDGNRVKGASQMGNKVSDKNSQVTFLKQRLNMFIEVLDAIEPENTELEDIDRLIEMIDDLESKCREFNNRD